MSDTDDYFLEFESDESISIDVLRDALDSLIDAASPDLELRNAANTLRLLLDSRVWPGPQIRSGAGWIDELPIDDVDLVVCASASPITLDAESTMSLTFGDWIGAVVQLVRIGEGGKATPRTLVDMVDACPDVDGEVAAELRPSLEAAFAQAIAIWKHCGVLDSAERLTAVGHWALPRALCWAWGGSFDS